jgi:hypothetical protein
MYQNASLLGISRNDGYVICCPLDQVSSVPCWTKDQKLCNGVIGNNYFRCLPRNDAIALVSAWAAYEDYCVEVTAKDGRIYLHVVVNDCAVAHVKFMDGDIIHEGNARGKYHPMVCQTDRVSRPDSEFARSGYVRFGKAVLRAMVRDLWALATSGNQFVIDLTPFQLPSWQSVGSTSVGQFVSSPELHCRMERMHIMVASAVVSACGPPPSPSDQMVHAKVWHETWLALFASFLNPRFQIRHYYSHGTDCLNGLYAVAHPITTAPTSNSLIAAAELTFVEPGHSYGVFSPGMSNADLLSQAGDVETNPGPWQWGVVSSLWLSWVWVVSLVQNFLVSYLDRWAYDCAMTEEKIRSLRVIYDNWLGVKIVWLLSFVIELPHYTDLKLPAHCAAVFAGWNKPVVPSMLFGSINLSWWVMVVTGAALSCCFASVLLAVVVSVIVLRRRRVVVRNNNGALDINALKDGFRRSIASVRQVVSDVGCHKNLAHQRRVLEAFAYDSLLDTLSCVRDVGGSRSRFPELGIRKHICCPTYSNDDILRDVKSEVVFDNCGQLGELCPKKADIPGALLSHVDYHLSQQQIVDIVTGPTFMINHNFRSRPVGLAGFLQGDQTLYEAKCAYAGDVVTMTTADGAVFSHGYHDWGNEGSVVGRDKALVYVRVGTYLDSQLYLLYPAAGVYKRTGITVLQKKSDNALPMISGAVVTRNLTDETFEIGMGATKISCPSEIIADVALAMASCPRDEKYGDTMRSMLSAKMASKGTNKSDISSWYQLVAYLSDSDAVHVLPYVTSFSGSPTSYSWTRILAYRCLLVVRRLLPVFLAFTLDRIVDHSYIRDCAEWTFPHHIVPTYEVYTPRNNSSWRSNLLRGFGKERFPPPAAANVSCGDKHLISSAGEINGQHDNIFRNPSAPENPTPTAPPHDALRKGPAVLGPFNFNPNVPPPIGLTPPRQPSGVSGQSSVDWTAGDITPPRQRGGTYPGFVSAGLVSPLCAPQPKAMPGPVVGRTVISKFVPSEGARLQLEVSWPGAKQQIVFIEKGSLDCELSEFEQTDFSIWFDDIATAALLLGCSETYSRSLSQWIVKVGAYRTASVEDWLTRDEGIRVRREGSAATDVCVGGAFRFRGVAVTVSRQEARAIAPGPRADDAQRAQPETRRGEELHKSGNKYHARGPPQHFPAERRFSGDNRPIHQRPGTRAGRSSKFGQGARHRSSYE